MSIRSRRCQHREIPYVPDLYIKLTELGAGLVDEGNRIAKVGTQQCQVVRRSTTLLDVIAQISDGLFQRVEAHFQVVGSVNELLDGGLGGLTVGTAPPPIRQQIPN